MSESITSQDLRTTLLTAIEDVRSGKLEINKARTMAQLSDKVISLVRLELDYSEVNQRLSRHGFTNAPIPLGGPAGKEEAGEEEGDEDIPYIDTATKWDALCGECGGEVNREGRLSVLTYDKRNFCSLDCLKTYKGSVRV